MRRLRDQALLAALLLGLLADLWLRAEGRPGLNAFLLVLAGASAVQLYSALVFEGPGLVTAIKRDLAARLKADGFVSVAAAVAAR